MIEVVFAGFKYPQITQGKMSHMLALPSYSNFTQDDLDKQLAGGFDVYIRPAKPEEVVHIEKKVFQAKYLVKAQADLQTTDLQKEETADEGQVKAGSS